MADVKLLASQRLTDNPDGGGLMTSTEIVDGVVNNLWPDVSRVDRAYGVVNLRKLFVKADTADTAIYSGLHVIVLFPPQDPRVNVTVFTTNNWADERSDAQSAVERYLDMSVPTRMIPFDRQLAGQRTIIVFQRPELDLPSIGEVYAIASLPDESTSQFVRVANIDQSVQTFTDSAGIDFKARIITLTLTEPLRATYNGSQPTRQFVALASSSHIRSTIVADAVSYHTVHALADDASIGDQTVNLGSIYTQLVPSSTSESALIGISPIGASTLVPSNTAQITLDMTPIALLWQAAGTTTYLPMAVMPGTVELYKANNVTHLFDDGAGALRFGSSIGAHFASIDYHTGQIVTDPTLPGDFSGAPAFAKFVPAAPVSKAAQTFQFPISNSTRGYVYIATLHPPPEPGNAVFAYRALGRWYELSDDGSGAMVGSTGVGTGSINYSTGVLSVSLGALPDIGSSAIVGWGGSAEFEIKVADVTISNPIVSGTLTIGSCKPSSMTVTWLAGGVTKTATDNGAGAFTGDATGRLVYGNGKFFLKPTLLPDPTTTFNFAFQSATTHTELFNPAKSGSTITVTVVHAPIRAKSILITYQQTFTVFGLSITTTQQLADDGAGNLVDADGNIKAGAIVDLTTGAIEFNPDFTMVTPTLDYDSFENQVPARVVDPAAGYFAAIARFGNWPTGASTGPTSVSFVNGTNVTVQYKEDSATDTSQTYSLPAPLITVDLTPSVSSPVVPGGVAFTLGGRLYVDRAGSLYYNVSGTTNGGSLGGSLDYQSGVATLTSWVGGQSSALVLDALVTQVLPIPAYNVSGRSPGSPLRPSSFFIQANKLDGTLINATADVDGNISTSNMHGYVDVTTGVFSVVFGAYVLDSSLTSDEKLEPWYNSSAVDGDGYIIKPDPVIASTIHFNAVVQVSLPLDSTILGIDPVRLPLDGRVQAIRAGDMLIVHDSQVFTMPGGLTAGQVVSLPRGNLAIVDVRDQTGAVVASSKFAVDLVAGEITMATPLSLSGYTQPLVATHRIEDASVVTDAQITGQVTVAAPLTHDYTSANSLASTALIAPFVGGSVQAAYSHLFSQQTWDSAHPNWTDAIVGNPTTAAFNDLDFPIQVLNRDAITEKWALIFTSATAFQVVGQDVGVIGTGDTTHNVSPLNPGTGNPYWVIDWHAFGSGWATGNAIRFDTQGAGFPVWNARTVRSGPATFTDDRDVIEPRWDKS